MHDRIQLVLGTIQCCKPRDRTDVHNLGVASCDHQHGNDSLHRGTNSVSLRFLSTLLLPLKLPTSRMACKVDPACSTTRLGRPPYRAILKAFIESAFPAWLCILIWAATGLRSMTGGGVNSSSNIVADVTYYILPVILVRSFTASWGLRSGLIMA